MTEYQQRREEAWKEWWLRWPGCIAKTEFKLAFEAGYEAHRAEIGEAERVIEQAAEYYKLPDIPCTKHHRCLWKDGHKGECHYRKLANVDQEETGNWVEGHTKRFSNVRHRHRDNQDGTGLCLDCGQSHYHTDPPLPYEATP